MSVSLPKMSNIISSNGLCYYKVPLDYTSTTDLCKYAFTVASKELDLDFNTHVFDASEYLPNCSPANDAAGLYKKVAVISGTPDIPYMNNFGIPITAPLAGTVKNVNLNSGIFFNDNSRLDDEGISVLNSSQFIGFLENSLTIGQYQDTKDQVISSGMYSGSATSYLDINSSDPSKYWTFISKVLMPDSSIEGYYMIGATSVEMKPSEIITQVSKEVNDDNAYISVVPLSCDNFAQMYVIEGTQSIIPQQLPVSYQMHTSAVSNAIVLWEKIVAYIPEALSSAPKNSDYIKVTTSTSVKQFDCYVQPSETSAKIGSWTVSNKFFKYYDVATSYDPAGNLQLWYRIGDPKEENNCWLKHVNNRTAPTAQAYFYFRLNRDVENFDQFNWQYAVVSKTNNTTCEKNNSYITNTNVKWHDFTYTDDNEWSDFIPVTTEDDPEGSPGGTNNVNTWVSSADNYQWLYIKAVTSSADHLMPFQVSYLQSDERVDFIYRGYDETNQRDYYVFRYKVDPASTYEFTDSSGAQSISISRSNFHNLEIEPIIRDNRVQVYGQVSYTNPPGGRQYEPRQVGSITFKQVIGDDEIEVFNNMFPRGSIIKAYATTRNGWNFNGFDGGDIIELPNDNNYEIYVVKGNFSRKNNPITLRIENTDINLGDIDIKIMGEKDESDWSISGNTAVKEISTLEGLELGLTATPKLIEDSGDFYDTGDLARWEYWYNTDPNDLTIGEWRLMNDIKDQTFEIKLWQTSGTNITHKDVYKYRAIWGVKSILY